jgi:hypothetical protein
MLCNGFYYTMKACYMSATCKDETESKSIQVYAATATGNSKSEYTSLCRKDSYVSIGTPKDLMHSWLKQSSTIRYDHIDTFWVSRLLTKQ